MHLHIQRLHTNPRDLHRPRRSCSSHSIELPNSPVEAPHAYNLFHTREMSLGGTESERSGRTSSAAQSQNIYSTVSTCSDSTKYKVYKQPCVDSRYDTVFRSTVRFFVFGPLPPNSQRMTGRFPCRFLWFHAFGPALGQVCSALKWCSQPASRISDPPRSR